MFLSTKYHFNSMKHDYFKTPYVHSIQDIGRRKDIVYFKKIGRHKDPAGLILSNILKNPTCWSRDLTGSEANEVYLDHQRRIQSLSYTFKSDIAKLKQPFDNNIKIAKDELPPLIREYIRTNITLETLTILCDLCKCYSYWNKRLINDPLWNEYSLRILKYRPFLQYDKDKFREILIGVCREET